MGENVDCIKYCDKAAAQQILVCKQMQREQNEKDKKRYKNLFSRIANEHVVGCCFLYYLKLQCIMFSLYISYYI
uniref:Uncharacterized protein n=1 Tax=Heterorhabditis bacteriophora TaxID=37862 RepID=A0A1I7WQB0_HETBA